MSVDTFCGGVFVMRVEQPGVEGITLKVLML